MKKTVKYIDPPGGWKYGFPRIIPDDITNIREWIVANGYPQSEIDEYGDCFFSRYWTAEVEDEE